MRQEVIDWFGGRNEFIKFHQGEVAEYFLTESDF